MGCSAMYYSGKRCDTFALAFAQMLAWEGRPQRRFVDCASLRCFGFRAGASIQAWFQPMISLPGAVSALAGTMGVPIRCEALGTAGPEPAHFVLGPLRGGVMPPELRDYYYHGCGRYLFLLRRPDGRLEVYDPRGIAGLTLPAERVYALAEPEKTRRVWIPDGAGAALPESPEELLARGLRFRGRIRRRERRAIARACGTYTASQANILSLQYGIQNLLLQMDQVFRLADACGMALAARYREEKQGLYARAMAGTAEGLPEALERIWRLLDGAG